jgi:hypothetical protein
MGLLSRPGTTLPDPRAEAGSRLLASKASEHRRPSAAPAWNRPSTRVRSKVPAMPTRATQAEQEVEVKLEVEPERKGGRERARRSLTPYSVPSSPPA